MCIRDRGRTRRSTTGKCRDSHLRSAGTSPAMPTARLQRAPERRAQQRSRRIEALDALRGLAIALMIFVNNPGDHDAMPSQFVHSDWHGFRIAELVFPLFLFSAGISMALSLSL